MSVRAVIPVVFMGALLAGAAAIAADLSSPLTRDGATTTTTSGDVVITAQPPSAGAARCVPTNQPPGKTGGAPGKNQTPPGCKPSRS
jgi:hypothetical protein